MSDTLGDALPREQARRTIHLCEARGVALQIID